MNEDEDEARVRRTLIDMKAQLEQNIAARLQNQLKQQTIAIESLSNQSSAKNSGAAAPPRLNSSFRRSRSRRMTLTAVAQGKRGAIGGTGTKRVEFRQRAHFPWRQVPERVKRTTFLTGKRRKVRGEVAKPVHIPLLLRLCSNPYVQFGGEIFLCVLCYTYFFVSSYQAFFDLHNPATTNLILVLDFVFLLNTLVRVLIELWRYLLVLEYTVLFIPCTPRFWIISLITEAPIDYIMAFRWEDSLTQLQWLDYLKCNRWLLPIYVHIFFSYLDAGHYVSSVAAFFLKFSVIFLAVLHIFACAFFAIGGGDPLGLELSRNIYELNSTWIGDAYRVKYGIIPTAFNSYILSLSVSASTVLTTGYGDIGPKRVAEMLLSIIVMLVGAIGLAGFFSSRLTGFFQVVDGARNELFRRLELIVRHLESLNAPAILVYKVREYYACLWNFRQGVHRVDSIRQLPGAMYEDILYDICSEMFNKSLLFRDLEEPFLRAVSKTVEILIYNPDMIVCRQGQPASAMYFIIQETRLFFSMNNPANIETRTCCQLLVIRKDRLLNIGLKNQICLNIMRARMAHRLRKLHEEYEEMGIPPITWVRRRKAKRGKEVFHPEVQDFKISLRWVSWFNRPVNRLDADRSAAIGDLPIIVDMPSIQPQYSSEKFVTYGDCVIPMTLLHPSAFVKLWHVFIAILTVPHFIATAFSYGFGAVAGDADYFAPAFRIFEYASFFIYLMDLMLEIFTAAPVTGIYYKLWDGLRVCRRRWGMFAVNIASLVPGYFYIDTFGQRPTAFLLSVLAIGFGRYLKLSKVVRYIHFLNESHPAIVPWIRLMNITFWLAFHAVIVGGFLFWGAHTHFDEPRYPPFKLSWLASYYMRHVSQNHELKREYAPSHLLNDGPITISIYYGVATFTTTGIGDFVPQSVFDTMLSLFWQIYAFFMLGVLAARLTSGLSSASLPRITFEGKLSAFHSFFDLHGLTMTLRDRIVEHYKLQYQLNEGISLPSTFKHLMYDAPSYLSDDALFAELSTHLEGIPVFTNSDPKTLIAMAKNMNLILLPPNITFIRRGEVRRQMYVISKGSLAVMKEDTNEVKSILVETGSLGLRDLLYGEPSFNNVKTLSYCMIYSIDLASFNDIMQEDEELMELVAEERQKLRARIRRLNMIFLKSQSGLVQKERKPSEVPSWIYVPDDPTFSNEWCSYGEFESGFKGRVGRIASYVLMRRTIHPAGTFALVWCLVTSVGGIISFMALMLEILPQYISPYFLYIELFLTILFAMDIYVRLHWGFYTKSNHLICHPYETAKHYILEGQFLFSFFFEVIPYPKIFWILGATNFAQEGDGFRWALAIQVHRIVHVIRVPIFIQFGRRVNWSRTVVLCLVYIALTLAISSLLASIAIYFACPWDLTRFHTDSPKKIPACFAGTWVDVKQSLRQPMSFGPPRWLVAVYYVCQVMFGIGYGDQATLKERELLLVIFLMIFGYVATRCIISDMTATAVASEEVRSEYVEKMKRITTVMKKQDVDGHLLERVEAHLQYVWLQSRGLEPQHLFRDLHPALLGDFYREYIGDAVASVPLLAGQSDNILRHVCTQLKRLYFVRGDVIARRNCLELEMYIIVEGKVWIAGPNLEIQCELGPGESFGETQMLYGIVRKYSAIAANNVEVFALSASGFANILEHYPSLKDEIIERMGGAKEDLYERKIYYINQNPGYMSPAAVNEKRDQMSDHIRSILSGEKNGGVLEEEEAQDANKFQQVKRFFARWLISWGSEDANLPFFYLATVDTARWPRFLLHPRCGFQRHFSTFILFVAWLSPAIGIYLLFFGTSNTTDTGNGEKYLLDLAHVLERIYQLHIALQFFTPFVTVEGKYCKEHCPIVFRNLFNVTYFWLDIVSTFPIEYAKEEKFITPESVRYFNVVRVLRLVHYFRTLHQGLDRVHVTTFRYNFVISVTSFALMIHVLACTFYFISECGYQNGLEACPENTWTRQFLLNFLGGRVQDSDLYRWRWYVRSLFWVVATMSTTGFGEIVAVSLAEVGMSIICIFCGAFVLAIVLSLFTQGLTSLYMHESDYLYQLKVDARYLRSLGLSTDRQVAFEEWFLVRWQFSRGVSFSEAVEILPLSMRNHINLALYHQTLSQVPLFDGLEQRFFLTLASLVEHTVYLEGQTVAFEGDHGVKLFIVSSGRVSGYRISQYNQPKLIRWYTRGCMFGRFPVFFYDETYTKTYRADILSEILVLRKKSLFYLARFFPAFALRLTLYVEANYDKRLGDHTVFDNPPEDEDEIVDPIKLMFKNASTQISEDVANKLRLKVYGERLREYYDLEGSELATETETDIDEEEEDEYQKEEEIERLKRASRIIVPKNNKREAIAEQYAGSKAIKTFKRTKAKILSSNTKAVKKKKPQRDQKGQLRKALSKKTIVTVTSGGRPYYHRTQPSPLVEAAPETLNWRRIRAALAKSIYKTKTRADLQDVDEMGQKYLKHRKKENTRNKKKKK